MEEKQEKWEKHNFKGTKRKAARKRETTAGNVG